MSCSVKGGWSIKLFFKAAPTVGSASRGGWYSHVVNKWSKSRRLFPGIFFLLILWLCLDWKTNLSQLMLSKFGTTWVCLIFGEIALVVWKFLGYKHWMCLPSSCCHCPPIMQASSTGENNMKMYTVLNLFQSSHIGRDTYTLQNWHCQKPVYWDKWLHMLE